MKCTKYGVLCNFSLSVPDLQPISEKSQGSSRHSTSTPERRNNITAKKSLAVQPYQQSPHLQNALTNAIWTGDGHSRYVLDAQDSILFTKFRDRTVYSLGGDSMVDVYENGMLQKCFTHPFLMHGTLAVAAVHDRYLGDINGSSVVEWTGKASVRESFHVSRCTSLFNQWLSEPMTEERKDPIWSGAGSLSILTFSSTTARRPEEAWPLGPPDPSSDLEWLRLGAGKMALWHMVNPMREGSIFRPMFKLLGDMRCEPLPKSRRGTEGLLPELAQVCDIDEESTEDNNPYFVVAHAMSRLLPLSDDEVSLGKVLLISRKMHGPFEVLLHERDPIALLLLCLWYVTARKCKWWIDFRTRHEIPAICRYLSEMHREKVTIHNILRSRGITEL